MRALVVFESMFGNTKEIAAAIAEGLAAEVSVDLVEVNDATTEVGRDVGLLVGGGPTHAFRMSRPRTRRDAATQAGRDPASAGIGIREWLAALRRVAPGKSAAAFDTRIDAPRVPGSAARAAERRLRKLGFSTAAPAESFFVSGTPRPLVQGELERARRWGTQLGSSLRATARRSTG